MNICIFGSANDDIDEDFLNHGYILGKTLANQGYNIVFGGGRDGMMGAVAKGAFENNGKVYGIAPSWISKFDDPFENCEEYIYTDGMDDRKELFFKKLISLLNIIKILLQNFILIKKPHIAWGLNLGGSGIRTHGSIAASTVFKTAPINHSGIPPKSALS